MMARRSRIAWLALSLSILVPLWAAAADDVVSSEDIAKALEAKVPDAKTKTRGLTLRPRTDSREAQAAPGSPVAAAGAHPGGPGGDSPAPAVDLNIPFELDSAALRADAVAQLTQLEGALKTSTLADARFRITGHTDASGSVEHNRRLSLDRARAVQSFLTAHGVASARLDVAGAGADRLLKPEAPRDAANRRVEIQNLGVTP